MKRSSTVLSALVLGMSIVFTGCGDSSDSSSEADPLELESEGKTMMFYSSSTNDHLAYDVDEALLTDLNGNTDDELENFIMSASDSGKLFIWIDDKGDDNASNDEEKVVMFDQEYSYTDDGNATWEDFYYLGHFHEEEEDGETHYHLAAHANEEFDVTEGAKLMAMTRLNAFLASEAATQESLENAMSESTLCGFKTVTNDNGTHHYVMGMNGTVYIYDDALSLVDSVAVTDSCEVNGMGISAVSEDDENGVVVFEANSQTLYLVDSHDDGVFHVHSSWDVSRVIGDGTSAQMMVSLTPVGYESEEAHEHEE